MKHTRPSEASQRSFSCQAIVTATHINGSPGGLNQRMFCRNSFVAAADQPKCDSPSPPGAADLPQQFEGQEHPGRLADQPVRRTPAQVRRPGGRDEPPAEIPHQSGRPRPPARSIR